MVANPPRGKPGGAGPAPDVVELYDIANFNDRSDLAPQADLAPECICPPDCQNFKPLCKEGESKCMYANTQVKHCELDGDGCWGVWSEPEPCPENTGCQTPGGCVCDYGACLESDDLQATCDGQQLTGCDAWVCTDGCCAVGKQEDCCEKSSECTDCISLETGEKLQPCPDPIPDEFVENKCTIDACMQGGCQWIDHECPDENPCTIEQCDPLTGACILFSVGLPPPECESSPCWGETQDDADMKCSDDNACTAQECLFGEGGFVPWVGSPPEGIDSENPPEGLGWCVYTDVSQDCGLGGPCTIYGCAPETGCWSGPDPSCCESDADCEKLDDNPCTTNKCYLEENECYVLDVDCDDGDPCTTDSCDPDSQNWEDPCVHEDVPDC